jgi:CRISPR-associated protein Csh2
VNRSELLFLYDISWANGNGDPADENKPRIDEETSRNIVTDVRLKRTIRDFLYEYKNQEIFVREIADEQGNIQDAKQRAEDFLVVDGEKLAKSKAKNIHEMKQIIYENMVKNCIDIRFFGGTVPIEKSTKEKSSVTLTGPVQFTMGTSLHAVKLEYIKGTGGFASNATSSQKTFREEYVVPYSLIAFYGVINEKAAIHTRLTEQDVDLLLEAIWNGTKSLISRSKVGQQPRMLLRVMYKQNCFQIGELHKLVSFTSNKEETKIRGIGEGTIEMSPLVSRLEKYHDRIERIEWLIDEGVICSHSLNEVCDQLNIPIQRLPY